MILIVLHVHYIWSLIQVQDINFMYIIILSYYIFSFIFIVSFYSDFQEKFKINVSITTYLFEIMDPCDEIILYLEGINGPNNDKYVDTIRIKTISESLPEYQLQRLVRKKQFDAAEAFANKFNLSTDPIYCAKVTLLLSQCGPWAKKNFSPVQLDMLFNIFDKIKDVQYVVECCNKALISEYKQMKKINLYAHSRVIEYAAVNNF